MSGPDSPPPAEPSLTRREKEILLQKMYGLPHWIAIIRRFSYQTLTMANAREAIKPIAEEFGKEKTADACEVLVEIVPGKEPCARLKAHIRRMAFQILGPEEPAAAPTPEPSIGSKPSPVPEKKRRRAPVAPPAAVISEPAPSAGGSAIMRQYLEAKEKHPNMILLFRIGDFYEVFNQDAEECHKRLGLTLTTRDREITMAGFPHHQLEVYLQKLFKDGLRVAVCDQVDDGVKQTRREITRVVPELMDREAYPIKQPRHFVLKKFEEWMKGEGLAFVAVADVKRTTPAVVPHVGSLDYIVLRGEEKMLVTVRSNLQAKHRAAIEEIQKLFGPEYRPVRIWPVDVPDGWVWREHAIACPDVE